MRTFNKLKKINIAVVTSDDQNILLPTWDKNIKFFKKKNINIKVLLHSKKKINNFSSINLYLWYFKTLKFKNFFLLILFSLITKFIRVIKNLPTSFINLSKRNNIEFIKVNNCEDKRLINWIKKEKIDVLLITTEDIINSALIKSVKKGIINKHASILPISKGLWPFFWNVINKNEQGVTYHLVSKKIDSGKILLQKKLVEKNSMIGFYLKIFNNYPSDIYSSIQILYNLKKRKLIKNDIASYNSLPKEKDYIEFKKMGGKIITFKDIFNTLRFNQ